MLEVVFKSYVFYVLCCNKVQLGWIILNFMSKWPRKIGHHLRTFSLCSAKLGICTIVCLVGGECTYYIHNKYRQRIVFCWWDCIQSTPLMMRYLKHFYIWDFVIHLRKRQIQKKWILFLIKNFKQKIQSIKAKNRGTIKQTS